MSSSCAGTQRADSCIHSLYSHQCGTALAFLGRRGKFFAPAGEYLVGYAVENAEGLYDYEGEKNLVWHEPRDENAHIEIVVCDAADRRFVPGLDVTVTVVDRTGHVVGTHLQPYLWHPWLYHYGRNWVLPGDGTYSLRVLIEPPRYSRHDKKNGKRFAEPVTLEFSDIRVKTGQKRS